MKDINHWVEQIYLWSNKKVIKNNNQLTNSY